jgi:DNA repair exonuclease SbcCD nuclease subunit
VGDLFNLKNPSKNPHSLVRELIELFRSFKCPVYMIPGNHDLTADRLESLKEQPLGVLFASGSVINLSQEEIKKDGKRVSLVGIPYMDDLDVSSITFPPKDDCLAQLCVMHVYAGPEKGKLFKERLYGYDELATMGADIYVIGHYHVDQGITEIDNKIFINLGSISRGTIAEENINHKPKIGIIKISEIDGKPSIKAESMLLKVKSVNEIFDLVKRDEEKRESEEIQKYVDKLAEKLIFNLSPISPANDNKENMNDIIEGMNITQIIKNKVLYYLQEAAAGK